MIVYTMNSWRSGKDTSVRWWTLEHPGLPATPKPRKLQYLPAVTRVLRAYLNVALAHPEEYKTYHKGTSFILYELLTTEKNKKEWSLTVSRQHQASSVESPESLCLCPCLCHGTTGLTQAGSLTPLFLSGVCLWGMPRLPLTMWLYCTCLGGDLVPAQAEVSCSNINAFLVCAIQSKALSPLWDSGINPKHKNAVVWVQKGREDEGRTWVGGYCCAHPYIRKNLSLLWCLASRKRALLVRSWLSALEQGFQALNQKISLIKSKNCEIRIDVETDTSKCLVLLTCVKLYVIYSDSSLRGQDATLQRDIKCQTLTFRAVPQVSLAKDVW